MPKKSTDPDGLEATAKAAFEIYQGMKTDKRAVEKWDDLTSERRGLLVWIARYARYTGH